MDPLAALKLMPCPKGASCTAFQCLFRHDNNDKTSIKEETENNLPKTSRKTPPPDTSDSQDTPRKRQKTTSAAIIRTAGEALSKATRPTESQPLESDSSKKKLNDESLILATRDKPVSPPPLSRNSQTSKRPASIAKTESPKDTTHNSKPVAATAAKSTPTKPNVPKPPAKVETLNPRHMPKAPAQHEVRLKLVKLLHEHYKRLNSELKKDANNEEEILLLTDQELIKRTLDEEQEIATKKPAVYANAIRNKIMQYKRMSVVQWKEERTNVLKRTTQPVGGSPKPEPVETIETGLTPFQEVKLLSHLAKPLDQYTQYGYVAQVPNQADVEAAANAVKMSGNTEACDRNGCGRRFQVFPGRREDGALTTNGTCIHHPGRVYTIDRSALDRTSKLSRKYRCCQTDVEDQSADQGCTTSPTHVFKASDPKRLANVLQFAYTPENQNVPEGRAIAFDCEMGYTVYGMELIRLTVVSWPDGKELLDILVQPFGEILDLNTQFSGVRPEDMANAVRWQPGTSHKPEIMPPAFGRKNASKRKLKLVPSPEVARTLMFTLINPRTPVIGHALENDLNAVRMIHSSIVDTVFLYPHPRGLPMRYGLKYLMEHHLNRRIQTAGEPSATKDSPCDTVGHDSAEDARAAGDLVRLKIREEWKRMKGEGWVFDDKTETFVQPGAAQKYALNY